MLFTHVPARANLIKAIVKALAKSADDAPEAARAARLAGTEAEQAAMAARHGPVWLDDVAKGDDDLAGKLVPVEVDDHGRILVGMQQRHIRTSEQLTRLTNDLGGDSRLIMLEDDAFEHKNSLINLLGDQPVLIVEAKTGKVRVARFEKILGRSVLRVQERSGLWIDAVSKAEYEAAQAILDLRASAHQTDLFSFFDPLERDVQQGLARAAGASYRAFDGAAADAMVAEVGRGRNRVIVLVSHVEGGKAAVRSPSGQITGSISLEKLRAVADRSDNTLIFLGCSTSRTRVGGFIMPVRTDPIVSAIARTWHHGDFIFGDFLASLGRQGEGFVVSAPQLSGLRRALTISPVSNSTMVQGIGAGVGVGSGLLLGTISAPSDDRQSELNTRFISFVPTSIQFTGLFGALMLVFAPRLAWRSWVSVLGNRVDMVPAGLYFVGSMLLFIAIGIVSVAILRAGVKLRRIYAVAVFIMMIAVLITSPLSILIMAAVFGVIALFYLRVSKRHEADGIVAKAKATLNFMLLNTLFQSVIFVTFMLPFWAIEASSDNLSLAAAVIAFVGGLVISASLVKRTQETPEEIFDHLWSDPFWPVRQLLRGPYREAQPA